MHHPATLTMPTRPTSGLLAVDVIAPIRAIAQALAAAPPEQDMLSGIHNPFGHHACMADAWSFLDIAENPDLLDCVAAVIGPDIVLWDSELYLDAGALPQDEARCWPVAPLAGAIAAVSLDQGAIDVVDIGAWHAGEFAGRPGSHFVVRYMPGSSLFVRDPTFAANRCAAELRPLVNYAKRPLWLVRGEDRAGNDFATGFMVPAGRWTDRAQMNFNDAKEKRHGATEFGA